MQTVLDESGYSAMLKNKKDLENENRLENINFEGKDDLQYKVKKNNILRFY